MIKILFLDDDTIRHDIFNKFVMRFPMAGENRVEVNYVWSCDAAKFAINKEAFDIYCLDHDLADEHYGVSAHETERSGYEVAKFMAENITPDKELVVIHSWNTVGADAMAYALEGFRIVKEMFGSRFFSFLGGVIGRGRTL